MATTEKKARKQSVTHSALTIAYMLNGANALDPMLVGHTDPVKALDRVIETLEKNGKDPEDLRAKRAIFAASRSTGVKGRKPAKAGDLRPYSVQKVGEDGDCFIRLPLGTLGVRKGDKVNVAFEDGEIRVFV